MLQLRILLHMEAYICRTKYSELETGLVTEVMPPIMFHVCTGRLSACTVNGHPEGDGLSEYAKGSLLELALG